MLLLALSKYCYYRRCNVSVNPGSDVSEPSSVSSSHALGASKKKKLLLACPQRDSHALGALHFFFLTHFSFFFQAFCWCLERKRMRLWLTFSTDFFPFFYRLCSDCRWEPPRFFLFAFYILCSAVLVLSYWPRTCSLGPHTCSYI